jgi:hypothetical protein
LILSVVYAYVTPSRYESTVSLMPPDPFVFSGSDMLGLGAGAGNHIARLRNTSRSPGH